jgi:aminomethyltransferase
VEKKTALYEEHVNAKARIVPFAGFLMPIQYSGIIEEHKAVREAAGMFDLSHMGEFRISGPLAVEAIDGLLTNDIRSLEVGQVRYSPMCYQSAGIVDDLLVYRFEDHLMLVVNASNIDKDLAWIRTHSSADVVVEDESDGTALIAVQGPRSEMLLQSCTELDLASIPYYHFSKGQVAGKNAVVSRTGYTGEDGFELYIANADASHVWKALLEAGSSYDLKLIGLGARDTLRLEAGYMLYGNDIDETTSPLEAGLGWTVKLGASDFMGRQEIERQKSDGLRRRMVALEMRDRSIPRQHYSIRVEGQPVGEVTSGTFSPTFGHGVGLGYIQTEHSKAGTEVDVDIRREDHPALIVRKPIYKREAA